MARRYPASRALLAAGWSLGANILLRYLGEEGPATPLQAAVSMCNPFNLTISNQVCARADGRGAGAGARVGAGMPVPVVGWVPGGVRAVPACRPSTEKVTCFASTGSLALGALPTALPTLRAPLPPNRLPCTAPRPHIPSRSQPPQGLKSGFSRIYDLNLATSLRNIFMKHALLWTGMPPPFRPDDVAAGRCPTIRDFDDAITIHSFGWPSVDAYYAGSSSALSVPHLPVPTLCIQVGTRGKTAGMVGSVRARLAVRVRQWYVVRMYGHSTR